MCIKHVELASTHIILGTAVPFTNYTHLQQNTKTTATVWQTTVLAGVAKFTFDLPELFYQTIRIRAPAMA